MNLNLFLFLYLYLLVCPVLGRRNQASDLAFDCQNDFHGHLVPRKMQFCTIMFPNFKLDKVQSKVPKDYWIFPAYSEFYWSYT